MTETEATHWIGGAWCRSFNGDTAESFDPSTGQAIGRFSAGGSHEAKQAIEAARDAFERSIWPQSPRLRQDILLKWADRLSAKVEELAGFLVLENGKAIGQARGELAGCISEIRYYAGLARYMPGHVHEVEPGVFSTVLREPAGVAALIIPWNAPAVLLIRSLAPALAAGCTVVIKPAAQTTLFTARFIAELAAIPGLPSGTVNLVSETGYEIGALMAESPNVDVVSFTGSTEIGRKIMMAAAGNMKKLSLELGGKSCCIVFPDADIQKVAPILATAATIISGQQCTAARRVLVHTSRFEEMKVALAAALSALRVGPGLAEATDMGPLIDSKARDQVEREINRAFDSADEVILRGRRPNGPLAAGAFLTPSLVAHNNSDAWFCQDEIFGPFVVIEPFESEEEAVAKANNSIFGLSGSVWTHDGARALRVARAMRSGTIWINDHNKLFAEAEMGGYRQSGMGRLHGFDALADFTEQKHVFQSVGTVLPTSVAKN